MNKTEQFLDEQLNLPVVINRPTVKPVINKSAKLGKLTKGAAIVGGTLLGASLIKNAMRARQLKKDEELKESQILHELIGKGFAKEAYRKRALLKRVPIENLTTDFAKRMLKNQNSAINKDAREAARRVASSAKTHTILSSVNPRKGVSATYDNPEVQDFYDKAREYGEEWLKNIDRKKENKKQLKKAIAGSALIGGLVAAGQIETAMKKKKKKTNKNKTVKKSAKINTKTDTKKDE